VTTVRTREVQVTREFSGATPVWTNATIYSLAEGTTDVTIPVLGSTDYAVRTRVLDVFGVYSEWSASTTQTTAVGADSQGLSNGTATVVVDEDGLHVTDGAIFIEDGFGDSVLTASGFGGSWGDFIRSGGIYNSDFRVGSASDIGVTEVGTSNNTADYEGGTTVNLPYWVVAASGGVLKVVADATAGYATAIESTATVAGQVNRFYQDIPINRAWRNYMVALREKYTITTGSVVRKVFASYRDTDHAIIGSRVQEMADTLSVTGGSYSNRVTEELGSVGSIPGTAVYIRIEVELTHTTTSAQVYRLDAIAVLDGFLQTGDFFTLYDAAINGHLTAQDAEIFDFLDVDGDLHAWANAQVDGTLDVTGALTKGGTAVSLLGHGAADHADITRKVFLPAALAKLDSATAANVGASPDLTGVVAYADAATQGAFWSLMVPSDWASGVITVQPVWSPGSTDASAHTVRWSLVAKAIAAGSTVTAAGTTVTFTGASAARTVGVVVYDTATSTTLTPAAAGDLFRVALRRIGADGADSYVGVVNLLGLIVSYTANQ
jgi:hypothetical protein